MHNLLAELGSEMSRLKKALRTLEARWNFTRQDWDDAVARRFEQNQLELTFKATTRAIEGINQTIQALRQAVEECS